MKNSLTAYFKKLEPWKQHGLAFVVILVLMAMYFAPMIFQNHMPAMTDTQAYRGASESIHEYNAAHQDFALWATNIFGGMPASNISVPIPVYSIDTVLMGIGQLGLHWQFVLFVFGGFFFYLFLRRLGLSWLAAMFGAVIFLLIPHHVGLINAGHNTKLRAMMLSPFLAWSFLYFVQKTSVLSFLLLALSLALEARSSHYQIVYYLGFLLLFLGLPYLIEYFRERQWKTMGIQVGLLVVAVFIGAVIAAPKLVLTREYLPYSIRGASGETAQTGAGGLQEDYATQWSFPPEEIVTFVMPDFFGLSSQYEYTGNAVPQLKGQTIPAYWGKLPFTTSTEYLGIVAVFLALIGVIGYWKRGMIKSLVALTILSLLISFGRHFSVVYDFFFHFFPLFNKFRIPSMILFLIEVTVAVFAAFGVQKLLELRDEQVGRWLRTGGGIVGGLVVLGFIALLIGGSLTMVKSSEIARYPEQTLQVLKTIRLELLRGDAWRLIIYSVLLGALGFFFVKRRISVTIFYPVLALLMLVDMYSIDHRFLQEWGPQQRANPPFNKTQIDNYIQQDTGLFRVFPVGNLFGNNRWCYFHQSIGGYHAAKMYIYQKMIEENLYHSIEPGNNINWNMVHLLNVKYLVASQQIQSRHLKAVGQDPGTKWILYEVANPFPRAWLVYRARVVPDEAQQRQILNEPSFDPAREALTGEPLLDAAAPDSGAQAGSVTVQRFDANHVTLNVSTPREGLVVLSENYLPIWWQATLDDQPVSIHKVNSLQRGVVVPPGNHVIRFVIRAPTFHASIVSANVFVWLVQGVIIILLALRLRSARSSLTPDATEQ